MTGRWVELADGVYARRYAELDLTVGLVVGAERALVIDTRGDGAQGAELAGAIREVTALPLAVAITHGHFDHCFGTAGLVAAAGGGPTPVYAHRGCAGWLRDTAEAQRTEWVGYYRSRGDRDTAAALAEAQVLPPDTAVDEDAEVDLGGRVARLLHCGPGHTDHDLAVYLPDAAVLFAGDLVEEGAPPAFEDADPLRWPDTLEALLSLRPERVVPGHGEPVPAAFVAGQRAELITVAELCRAVRAGELSRSDAEAISPYPATTTRAALSRI